jgi:aminomethyltransferase
VQGPKGLATLQKLTSTNLSEIKYYWFTDGEVSGTPARIARTGYTGEDGFEIYIAPERSPAPLERTAQSRRRIRHSPLRLRRAQHFAPRSGHGFYGHELTASINPLEANLGWIVKMDKGDFVGRAALEKRKPPASPVALVGFEMKERGIGRDGYEVWVDGKRQVGSPAEAHLPPSTRILVFAIYPRQAQPGGVRHVIIRNSPVEALTVPDTLL